MLKSLILLLAITATLASGTTAQVTWGALTGVGSPPPPYCGYTWDSHRNRLVTFGGSAFSVEQTARTEWTGSIWISGFGSFGEPSARERPAIAYDEARAELLLFGGGVVHQGDTWTRDIFGWNQRSPVTSPSPRSGAAMAYDAARQVVVLHGGFVPSGNDSDETWEWNGLHWTKRSPAGVIPTARGAHRMVYDSARQLVLIQGGYSTPSSNTLADTWTWDGSVWTQAADLPSGSCRDHVMVFDPTRQRVIHYGGVRSSGPGNANNLSGVSEFDGTSWLQRTPLQTISGHSAGAHAWDPIAQRLLLGGGATVSGLVLTATRTYAPVDSAAVSSFGSACTSSVGPVDLQTVTLPYVGLTFEQQICDAAPSASIALLLIGMDNAAWGSAQLPLELTSVGAPGCHLLVRPDLLITVPLSAGTGTVNWQLPNATSCIGETFFTQGLVLDPTSPLPFQIDMTSARALLIGSP